MHKGFQRQLAQGALTDGGEDHIAQLLKSVAHEPRHAVGDRQAHGTHGQRPTGCGLTRQRVDGGLVKERCAHGHNFGEDKDQKGHDDTPFDPWFLVGPEIGDDPLDHMPTAGCFRIERSLGHFGFAHGHSLGGNHWGL